MPELPEVETVRKGLEQAISGALIRKVTLRREGLREPFPKGFAKALEGQEIKAVERRAKYLLIRLSSGMVWVAHLGMSGRFSVLPKAPKEYGKHDHLVATMQDGRVLVFNDPRRFGIMLLAESGKEQLVPQLASLGLEPLSADFNAKSLALILKSRKAPVKTVIMDQKNVVGVGNIYASEALFLAGIHPEKPACDCVGKASALAKAIRKVLADAIASGGSSLRDFLHLSGESGYFQHHFNVYGRKDEPCVSCGKPIRMLRQAGRSTFYCAKCQD